MLDLAVKTDRVLDVETFNLPGVTLGQPRVRQLDLAVIHDALLKQPVRVAQSIPTRRKVQGRHGIHETRSEPPKAAVAEGRIIFLLVEILESEAQVE